MIVGLHHAQITIPTGMETEGRSFYCDLLGLKEIPKPEILINRGGFWLAVGELAVHVSIEDGVDRENTRAHLAYCVSDLNYWRRALTERGIDFAEGIPIPGMARIQFRDPFGNRVEMVEQLGESESSR